MYRSPWCGRSWGMRALHHFGVCNRKLVLDRQLLSVHVRLATAVVRGVGTRHRVTLGGKEKPAGTRRHGNSRAWAQTRFTEELGRQAYSSVTLDLEVHHNRHRGSTLAALQDSKEVSYDPDADETRWQVKSMTTNPRRANSSTLRRATSTGTPSLRVTVTKYSCSTWVETTPTIEMTPAAGLRAGMNLVAVESPPSRAPLTFHAQEAKLGDVRFGIAFGDQAVEVFPDQLVEAFAE